MIVIGILVALRKVQDTPPAVRARFDLTGALLSVAGLSLLVFGVLKSGTWGFVKAKPGGPELLGTSPVVWQSSAGYWSSTASSCGKHTSSTGDASRSSGRPCCATPSSPAASSKHLRDAVALLESKATAGELDDYRRFVLALASKVAAAHKEEGQSVSPAEAEAIQEITAALGTTSS